MSIVNISISAPNIDLAIVDYNIPVDTPNYSTVAYTPTSVALSVPDPSIDLNVVMLGLGEESLPEPTLFRYNPEYISGFLS